MTRVEVYRATHSRPPEASLRADEVKVSTARITSTEESRTEARKCESKRKFLWYEIGIDVSPVVRRLGLNKRLIQMTYDHIPHVAVARLLCRVPSNSKHLLYGRRISG